MKKLICRKVTVGLAPNHSPVVQPERTTIRDHAGSIQIQIPRVPVIAVTTPQSPALQVLAQVTASPVAQVTGTSREQRSIHVSLVKIDLNIGTPSLRKGHIRKKKSRKSKKSGISAKASSKVRSPQRWVHSALQMDFINTEVAFKNIDFPKLVAGEMEIIMDPCTPKKERQGRLSLLRDLSYQKSNNADIETIRNIYGSVLRKLR